MRTIISLLVGLFAYVSVGMSGAHAQDARWTLIETAGPVFVAQPLGAPRFVSLHETIAPGSTLTTGGNARAVVSNGAQNITVGPNSRIALPAASANGMTRIIQDFGAAMFKVDKRKVQHFEVDTPLIAAVVKGTTFTVSVTAGGHSVHVVEGLVEVSMRSGGPAVPVRAGATAMVSRDNPSTIQLQDSNTSTGDAQRGPAKDLDPSDGTSDRRAGGLGTAIVASLAIPQTIGAGPLDFEELTNGLVGSGRAPGGAVVPTAGNAGNGSSNAGSNAGGNGSGNAGGSANASGNSNGNSGASANAGGNGNSGASANASGNGNAGAGANAGGNGNAGANGNGNAGAGANAGGNGNAGANGNGNAGASPIAGGNGNGNAGGNANAGGALAAQNGNANGKGK